MAQGATLGSYTIMEQLGRGGMAAVYKAYHARLDRYVAIKVMLPVISQDPGFRERFEQEARAVARFRHPNIVTIHDYGEQDGLAYLVTELIDGGTLADQTGSPLDPGMVVRVIGPIASALDYAHERGVLHRDVKPSNVLLRADVTPVLSDFGIAKLSNSSVHMTRTGLVMGTPAYQAPEQASGEPAGNATDQYALGIVAYELLTGRVPYSAETPMAVLLAHLIKPLPPPRELNAALSDEIEQVLLKTLAKSPADRYPTVSDFAAALAEAVAVGGYGPMVPPGPTPSYATPATPAWFGTPRTPVRPPFVPPPDAALTPPPAAEPAARAPLTPSSGGPAVDAPRTPLPAPGIPPSETVVEPAAARAEAPPSAPPQGPFIPPAPPAISSRPVSGAAVEPAAPAPPPVGRRVDRDDPAVSPSRGSPAGGIVAGPPAAPAAPPVVQRTAVSETIVESSRSASPAPPSEEHGVRPPLRQDSPESGGRSAPASPNDVRAIPVAAEARPPEAIARATPEIGARANAPSTEPLSIDSHQGAPAFSATGPTLEARPGEPPSGATVAEPLPNVAMPTALEPLPPVQSVVDRSPHAPDRGAIGAATTMSPSVVRAEPKARALPLPLIGGALAIVVVAALGVLVFTRQPTPVPPPAPTAVPTNVPVAGAVATVLASAKTAAPTLLATAVPTVAPTSVPTAAPAAQPTAAPTAAARPAPTNTPAPAATPDEEQAWQQQEAALNAIWGKDWPRSISQLTAFLKRYPNNTDAKDKLYAALISYGDQLIQAGNKEGAAQQYAAAHQVYPDRPEASAALAALTPAPVPTPTPTPVPAQQPAQAVQQQPVQQQPVQQPVQRPPVQQQPAQQQPVQQQPVQQPKPPRAFTPVAERIHLATPTPEK